MLKNIIAAFAALALLPSVGLAATTSLSKSSEKTFTYTIRAKDTARTTLLSTNGATECSYVAQISGGATLTLTGDAAEAVSASGSGTIATTGGQFSAQFDTVSVSNVIVTCTPGGSSEETGPPATGVDTVLTFDENSDFNGDTHDIIIPATVDLLTSTDNVIGPFGMSTDRHLYAFVDDANVAETEEYVRFGAAIGNSNTSNLNILANVSSVASTPVAVFPIQGGNIVGKSLSVSLAEVNNTSGSHECKVTAYRYTGTYVENGTSLLSILDSSTDGNTDFQACGSVEVGFGSDNSATTSSGLGLGDASPRFGGNNYTTRLTNCAASSNVGFLIVAVAPRDGGTCTRLDGAYITLGVGETF